MLGSKAGRCCELIWEDEHNTFITGCFNSMNGKILLVEDDTGFGTMLRKWFERNDLVTEMKEIKHYYTKGISARKGIEY